MKKKSMGLIPYTKANFIKTIENQNSIIVSLQKQLAEKIENSWQLIKDKSYLEALVQKLTHQNSTLKEIILEGLKK